MHRSSLADNSVQRLFAFSDDRYSTEAMTSNFSNYDMRNLLVAHSGVVRLPSWFFA